jgi:predicted SprT family Zn-dependent metalloprotease
MKSYELIGLADMKSAIKAACKANGCPDLAKEINIQWTRRVVQTTGQVNLREKLIQLSAPILRWIPYEKQLEAVAHETCRIIAWVLYQESSHHKTWRACMLRAGYPNAKRLIEADEIFQCACPEVVKLPVHIAKLVAVDGKEQECQHCKTKLKWVTIVYQQVG